MLKERYATSMRCTEAVTAEMEGLQAERDFAQLEKEGFRMERESLRTSKDEALLSNDRMLGQLTESRNEAHIMEASLEGVQIEKGLGELVCGSEARKELLLRYFSTSLERTVQAIQPKLEEADDEVPPLFGTR
ncbi:hypothetical protein LIER_14800 [Lithospermum erythrorhizon]|uniref:Uncharacterized protein n=1 Tax=Lithospermum erythrorhizon TaxID=34254 RepID=A0AAV3Q0U4_LITER